MKKYYLLLLTTIFIIANSQAQSPAGYDLIICKSTDGINWTSNALFQDSSGVPSITQHSTGVLFTAFQWFPAPATATNTSWGKIAIKKSTDNGLTWGTPTLAVFTGSPTGYKRPFDPTLVIADNGNIRMYFSSSKTGSLTILDTTVHCYSAISSDGINFAWEAGVRVAVKDSINIDPAVIKIGSNWHYTCPRAMPSAGAHHYISTNGLAFTRTMTVLSDVSHNFTGNLMSNSSSDFRFYGTPSPAAGAIWYKSTVDGFAWNPSYQNCVGPVTNSLINADPSAIKVSANNYILIYVSKLSSITGLTKIEKGKSLFTIYPNPSYNTISVKSNGSLPISKISIFDLTGKLVFQSFENNQVINHSLQKGVYVLEVLIDGYIESKKLIIE